MKVQLETQSFEMCVRSQFGKVFRLYGDLEMDKGQSYSNQSYNGLSGSYLKKMSITTDCPAGRSQAVHIPFHRPIKESQKGWME